MISNAFKRVMTYSGYGAFFLASFLLFFVILFPAGRFAPAVERKLSEILKRKVSVGDLSVTMGGDIVLSSVELEVENEAIAGAGAGAGEESKEKLARAGYFFDEVDIDVGYISFLLGRFDLGLEIQTLGGEIEVRYKGPIPWSANGDSSMTKTDGPGAVQTAAVKGGNAVSIHVEARDLSLSGLPVIKKKLPVPVKGVLGLTIDLESPTDKLSSASGRIVTTIKDLVVGSDQSKIDLGGLEMSVVPIKVSSIDWEVVFKKGEGEVSRFKMVSEDFDANIQGSISIREPLAQSRVDLYVTFKFLDKYINKSEITKMFISNIDKFSNNMNRALRTDGYYGFRYRGLWGRGRFTPSKEYAGGRRPRSGDLQSRRARMRANTGLPSVESVPGIIGAPESPPLQQEPPPPLLPPPLPPPVAADTQGQEEAREPQPAEMQQQPNYIEVPQPPPPEEPPQEQPPPEEQPQDQPPSEEPPQEQPPPEEPPQEQPPPEEAPQSGE